MEYDKIKQLMEDMGNSKLTSIDIDFADGTKIKMTKQNNQTTKDNYFVEKNNIGYVCDYTEEALKSLLSEITLDELKHKRNIIYDVAKNNTWEVRCQTIVDLLKK